MRRQICLSAVALVSFVLIQTAPSQDKNGEAISNRPAVPGKLQLKMREHKETVPGTKQFAVRERIQEWDVSETAIIICDMWDDHFCKSAAQRVGVMVPKMNQAVTAARNHGVMIIHAPSACMDAYKDHPGRKLAQSAPKAKNLPTDIHQWCYKIPTEEKVPYPIDQSDGGEDDDPREHAEWHAKLAAMGRNPKAPWKKQHDGIKILGDGKLSKKLTVTATKFSASARKQIEAAGGTCQETQHSA